MNNIKNVIIGTVITIIIGGTAYTISQQDIVKNFAKETGLTQQQAEHYIDKAEKEELFVSFSEGGNELINFGQEGINVLSEIDCINYENEWELSALSCQEAKKQLNKLARNAILLGQSYLKLDSDSASTDDMQKTIRLIDQFNSDLELPAVGLLFGRLTINEFKKSNLYNKAFLKTVIESDN